MAAATESPNISSGYSPQEILQEVRNFLHGANYKAQNQKQRESLAQSALILLRTLPTARHAVLEYMANMFDEAVNNYLLEMDIGHKVTDTGSQVIDSFLHDACGVLHAFIQTNSVAWAPIISSWSLELLGHISSKYADRRGVPHTGSLNELLQLWLTCVPTKLLIEVATECFAQMVSGAPENCVDSLLEASVKYTPHFDWVVAHIGSAFPRTIITRVLMCGLKDYCHHGNHGDGNVDTKIPKMGSVVGILGHLASKHGHDIRDALLTLFQESLDTSRGTSKATTVPFLLQLASMSPLLLHILATDLVNMLNATVLNHLHVQMQPWVSNYPQEFKSMMTLVVHLVMQTDVGADKVLHFLVYNATVTKDDVPEGTILPLPEIQKMCSALLDQILNETQASIYRRGRLESSIDLPFLGALGTKLSTLTKDLLNSTGQRCKWLQRLICYIILYKGEKFGADTLAFILSNAVNNEQLAQFIKIQQNIEMGMGQVLSGCVQQVMDLLQHQRSTNKLRLLNNLYALTKWEASLDKTIIRATFKSCLESHWECLSKLLLNDDVQVSMVILKLLNYVTVPRNLSSGAALSVCGSLVALFFNVLNTEDTRAVNPMVQACKRCARLLSSRPYAQSILVRYLIEGAVDCENKHLLGGKTDLGTATSGSRDSHTSLRAENKKHGVSLTTLRSHSSVFHAGVIGHGLRAKTKLHTLSKELVDRNCLFLEEMLWDCCKEHRTKVVGQSEGQGEAEGQEKTHVSYNLRIPPDLCRMIGTLLVEMTTPDVLYNNRFWPEEESLKMTVERDLHVWKFFDDNPVLWRILQMVAGNTLVISRCSAVLKSLTATMMHHFELSREKMATNTPKQLESACYLVRSLGKSGLLPHPLNIMSELFPSLTPYEVYLILLAIWRFMKENPPTEDPDEVTRRVCEPRHLEVVKSIVHCNIETFGQFYARFFPQGADVKQEEDGES
ncbi:integrator complex subunit 5-like [Ruditapes philippinarum]|uniref:integrator complex subunit 5-like n=1 Tax=Ruditapes philippinarum TaxID=129788 RepID=UPI00295BEDB9|nr:integrator complex subunit 5-like [Ruditapes philippinarum]